MTPRTKKIIYYTVLILCVLATGISDIEDIENSQRELAGIVE